MNCALVPPEKDKVDSLINHLYEENSGLSFKEQRKNITSSLGEKLLDPADKGFTPFPPFSEKIPKDPDETRRELLECLQSGFKNDECFLFHKINSGIDPTVISQFMKRLRKEPALERRKKLRAIANLVGRPLDDPIDENAEESIHEQEAEKEMETFEKDVVNGQSGSRCILLVNFTRAIILFFDLSESSDFLANASSTKKFFEHLLLPTGELVWRFLAFEVNGALDTGSCMRCQHHRLQADNMGNISDLVDGILRTEHHAFTGDQKDERRADYHNLVSNIVTVSSLDCFPQSHTIGQAKTGLADEDSPKRLLMWSTMQVDIKLLNPQYLCLESDFGTGKSLILHSFIERCIFQKLPHNFIVSLQPQAPSSSLQPQASPPPRTILDVSNSVNYDKIDNIHVVSLADIVDRGSDLRKKLNMEGPDNAIMEPLQFIEELTQKYSTANIAVDEVNLDELRRRRSIHHPDFRGSLWISISALSNYDFSKEDDPMIAVEGLPSLENFFLPRLTNNLRNGDQIVNKSLTLQKDNTVAEGTLKDKRRNIRDMEKTNVPKKVPDPLPSKDHPESPANPGDPVIPDASATPVTPVTSGAPVNPTASDMVWVSVIKDGVEAFYRICKQDVTIGCASIPGSTLETKNVVEGEEFLTGDLQKRLNEGETIVVLGNDDKDMGWILQTLPKEKQTVYDPTIGEESDSVEDLKKILKGEKTGCLVTCGSLLNGMECKTLVFVYDNPFSSHFRSNFLRASHELILIDRNTQGKRMIKKEPGKIIYYIKCFLEELPVH